MSPLIPAIIGAISLLEKLIPLINEWREAAKQSGEMTPEQEAEFRARIEAVTSAPWWQPEPVTPPAPTPAPTPIPAPPETPITPS